jgi:hypothetical protein
MQELLCTSKQRYEPNPKDKAAYDRNYEVFIKLYKSNREHSQHSMGSRKRGERSMNDTTKGISNQQKRSIREKGGNQKLSPRDHLLQAVKFTLLSISAGGKKC